MTLALAPVLDTPAAGLLRVALRQALEQGQPLLLDGSAVERAGQACLQVLAAGERSAQRPGLDFRVDHASPALAEMAALAGLGALLAA